MFEALVAATATTGLLAVARMTREQPITIDGRQVVDLAGDESDLPCPWCRAATKDTDQRCPSCGRRFG